METTAARKLTGRFASVILLLISCICLGCSERPKDQKLRVLVAASAANASRSAIESFCSQFDPDSKPAISVVSGPSNGLARQIQSGAPGHIFISANPAWTDAIKDQCSATETILRNRLVLASSSKHPIVELSELTESRFKRIAIAAESVPVGHYARQVIGRLPLAEQDELNSKFVFAKDASALVAWLENETVDAAFVYSSDISEPGSFSVLTIDEDLHDPITYTIAKLKPTDGHIPPHLEQLYSWLLSENCHSIFQNAGFTMPHRRLSNSGRSTTVE